MRGFSELIKTLKLILKLVIGLGLVYGLYVGIDFIFKDIFSYQARAVLANFIVFAGVIAFVIIKVANTSKVLSDAQQSVSDEIYNSEQIKVESMTRLSGIEDSMANIEEEIDEILSQSAQNAQLVGEKILAEADKSVLVLRENTEKSIMNSRTGLRNDLLKRTSMASVEIAKQHIQQELNNNQELHDRLIDESIEAINVLTSETDEEIA